MNVQSWVWDFTLNLIFLCVPLLLLLSLGILDKSNFHTHLKRLHCSGYETIPYYGSPGPGFGRAFKQGFC